mmetsp:Transcript_27390/g.68047  ORF Transcript_27390/g.68047 Transcript_27390/m.68047 type:complete len:815 (+) Transcript_27390:2314-4758(+)
MEPVVRRDGERRLALKVEVVLAAHLHLALHDDQPVLVEHLLHIRTRLQPVIRHVEEALGLDRVHDGHDGRLRLRLILHLHELRRHASLLGGVREHNADRLPHVKHTLLREHLLVLDDRPDRVVPSRGDVAREVGGEDALRREGLARVDRLDGGWRSLRTDEPPLQPRAHPCRRQRHVVRVLRHATHVQRARRVRQRLAHHSHAARLGGHRVGRLGDPRLLLRLGAGVAGLGVSLRAAHRRLGLTHEAARRRSLRRADERRRRRRGHAGVGGGVGEAEGDGDEPLEEEGGGESAAVLRLPSGRGGGHAQLLLQCAARRVERPLAPLGADERGGGPRRDDGRRRHPAEGERRVGHDPAGGVGRRRQLRAQSARDDRDVVLAAASLLERKDELERRRVRHPHRHDDLVGLQVDLAVPLEEVRHVELPRAACRRRDGERRAAGDQQRVHVGDGRRRREVPAKARDVPDLGGREPAQHVVDGAAGVARVRRALAGGHFAEMLDLTEGRTRAEEQRLGRVGATHQLTDRRGAQHDVARGVLEAALDPELRVARDEPAGGVRRLEGEEIRQGARTPPAALARGGTPLDAQRAERLAEGGGEVRLLRGGVARHVRRAAAGARQLVGAVARELDDGGRGVGARLAAAAAVLTAAAARARTALRVGAEGLGGVPDRPVAGATAEVAVQTLLDVADREVGLGPEESVERHHDPRSAEAALRAVKVDHPLLHRVKPIPRRADAFDGRDRAAIHRAERHEARVHRRVPQLASGGGGGGDHHRACAAPAFPAAELRAGEADRAKPIEQSGRRGGFGEFVPPPIDESDD